MGGGNMADYEGIVIGSGAGGLSAALRVHAKLKQHL